MTAPRTLTEKIWDAHVVYSHADEPDLLFIDLHLIHEVTSPQAFDGIRLAGRTVGETFQRAAAFLTLSVRLN